MPRLYAGVLCEVRAGGAAGIIVQKVAYTYIIPPKGDISMREGQGLNTISALLGSDTWSNAACCGYVLLACKNLGYTKQESRNLLEAVNSAFKNYTIQQAEKEYYKT